jgi:hypothetical protein
MAVYRTTQIAIQRDGNNLQISGDLETAETDQGPWTPVRSLNTTITPISLDADEVALQIDELLQEVITRHELEDTLAVDLAALMEGRIVP